MKNGGYGFSDYQMKQREVTIGKIQSAIDELKSEGAIVTKPRLVERTGLSRAVFDKPHVLEVLKESEVCEFAPKLAIKTNPLSNKKDLAQFLTLEKENRLLKERIEQLTAKSNKYQADYLAIKEAYQLLLGEWHLLLKKARIRGLKIDGYME